MNFTKLRRKAASLISSPPTSNAEPCDLCQARLRVVNCTSMRKGTGLILKAGLLPSASPRRKQMHELARRRYTLPGVKSCLVFLAERSDLQNVEQARCLSLGLHCSGFPTLCKQACSWLSSRCTQRLFGVHQCELPKSPRFTRLFPPSSTAALSGSWLISPTRSLRAVTM